MPRTHHALWLTAGALTAAGWVLGYFAWAADSGAEYGGSHDLFSPAALLLTGLPVAVLGGFLMGRRGILRWLGVLTLAGAALVAAYWSFWAFFGAMCIDPGEVCVTTWSSRSLTLGVALGCLSLGWMTERVTGSPSLS